MDEAIRFQALRTLTEPDTIHLRSQESPVPIASPRRTASSSEKEPSGRCGTKGRAGDLLGRFFRGLLFPVALYGFLLSIDLMSKAFKLAGGGFAERLIYTTSDPLAGLLIGLITTSLVQSSSSTTSITVGLVAAGILDLRLAIPIVMGANIGTTVTNTIVSIGHVTRRKEFQRAFAAGTVHDFFNVLAVAVLFPLELLFHPVERVATLLERLFAGVGGVHLVSPIKAAIKPATHLIADLLPWPIVLLALALLLLFASLSQMVRVMRRLVVSRVEGLFSRVLFRNDGAGFLFGWILTSIVQSSSVTTSLVVPLVGTGVLSVRRIYPYTLGANLGTTVTAILASFATGNPAAIVVAFAHMTFNLMGIAIFYPAKRIPISLALRLGRVVGRSKRNALFVIVGYAAAHAVPIVYVILRSLGGGR